MSNVFESLQLQRIADYIDAGKAGGGTLTMDVTGAGDMQGATAGQAGVHGLVPAPAAGDQDKYLSGGGTWEDLPASGGVDYSTSEQDTGLKWIDGITSVYERVYQFSPGIAVGSSPITTTIDSTNMDLILSVHGIHSDGTGYSDIKADPTYNSHTNLGLSSAGGATVSTLILRYTKI